MRCVAGGSSVRRRFDAQTSAIGPYVPSPTADWLRGCPEQRHRALEGTLVFADVSGFTRLTG
jgi:class 3 adenylate cyclase